MKGIEIMPDGVIIQQAAELLLHEPGSTSGPVFSVRQVCRDNYYESLEQFVFAAVFCKQIITAGELPGVLDWTPGETILGSNYLGAKHQRRPPEPGIARWETLLPTAEFQTRLKTDLQLLTRITTDDELRRWQQHFVREAWMYLGNRPSLTKANAPDEYEFQERGNFEPVKPYRTFVPVEFVTSMRDTLRLQSRWLPNAVSAHDDSLLEFVCRNTIAHIAIFEWYCTVKSTTLDTTYGARMPVGTRRYLAERQKALWRVKKQIIPGMLRKMILESGHRSELRGKIFEACVNPVYDPIRDKIAEALALYGVMESGTLLAELETDIALEINARKLGPTVSSSAFSPLMGPYQKALKMLVIEGGAGPGQGMPDCSFVLPELADGRSRRQR